MNATALPPKASLEQLKNQAKDILKAHRKGDSFCCDLLRQLRQFTGQSDTAILKAEVKLSDVHSALAMHYGCKSWADMKAQVAALDSAREDRKEGFGENTCRRCGDVPLIDVVCLDCGEYVVADADNSVWLGDDGLVYQNDARMRSQQVVKCKCGSTNLEMQHQTHCGWCVHMLNKDD